MSEIRVDRIEPLGNSVNLVGVTTFSHTGSLDIPGGTEEQRPSDPALGQIRYILGELTNAVEYYNGTDWKVI